MLQKWESKWQMAFNTDKCFVIKPSVLLALLVMLLMCAFQVRSLLMVTPRYLLSSVTSNM
jgi:hypothetical protein